MLISLRLCRRVMNVVLVTLIASVFCDASFLCSSVRADDWPMWRYDAERSGATPTGIPAELNLRWRRDLPAPRPAWPEDPRLLFDATYEPVVADHLIYVASAQTDSVTAYDTQSGRERWQHFTNGPVRFAPVVVEDAIMFGSDDGFFYCLDAVSGDLRWKLNAAPGERIALGNNRLVSIWPVRGGAVLADGRVHFTAGVWPFEGSYLYSFDATAAADTIPPTPKVTLLPRKSPQGYLVSNGPQVFIPSGRDAAMWIHHGSGSNLLLKYQARELSDYHVTISGKWLLHGHQVVSYGNSTATQFTLRRPVTRNNVMYGAKEGAVVAHDLNDSKIVDAKYPDGRPYKMRYFERRWQIPADEFSSNLKARGIQVDPAALLEVNLCAGSRLYGHWGSHLFAVDMPADGPKDGPKNSRKARVSWTYTMEGDPASILAADDHLFVTNRQGQIFCFGAGGEAVQANPAPKTLKVTKRSEQVAELLAAGKASDGYCLLWGLDSEEWVDELLRQSDLHVVAFDPSATRVAAMRKTYTRGKDCVYGKRLSIVHTDPVTYQAPRYLANLIVVPEPASFGLEQDAAATARLFNSLRPYGGTCCLIMTDEEHEAFASQVDLAALPSATVERQGSVTLLVREGPLPGAADWTHEFGDKSNSLMSKDRLVKSPLGVLWFGGAAAQNELFFDRHFWGPSATIIDGRMFLQGPERFGAVDIYTGRVLWKIPLHKGSSPGRRGNFYDGDHNTGYHFLALEDAVYLAQDTSCWHLDPATGEKRDEFKLPDKGNYWGPIRAADQLLIVQAFDSLKKSARPVKLVALNRKTGELVWQKKAEREFPLVAIGEEKLFCLDGELPGLFNAWKRGGKTPKSAEARTIMALDVKTGEVEWEKEAERQPTWLSFAGDQDVLMTSNREGIDALSGESGSKLWSKSIKADGFHGHPENRWDRLILWNDWVIDQRGPASAYNIKTGEKVMRKHPVTDEEIPWEYTQSGHHCAYAIACENLLTFRASTGGFVDLETLGSNRLEGFRPGCRNSLIPAGGILNSPNFGHGCVCSYSIFTSLALVHVPEVETWSYSALQKPKAGTVKRIGINLGAPGDRLADNGTLWVDYPSEGGSSPDVKVKIEGDQRRRYRMHSRQVSGDGLTWVGASGVEGLRSLNIRIPRKEDDVSKVTYRVRLYFVEPDDVKAGERVFDVSLNGQKVVEGLDVAQLAGGPRRLLVKEFETTAGASLIRVDLKSITGKPILGGVELLRN